MSEAYIIDAIRTPRGIGKVGKAALDARFDIKASGGTLGRFCGSGITAVNLAAAQVMSGMAHLVIAGGTEMMSHVMDYGAEVCAAGGMAPAVVIERS